MVKFDVIGWCDANGRYGEGCLSYVVLISPFFKSRFNISMLLNFSVLVIFIFGRSFQQPWTSLFCQYKNKFLKDGSDLSYCQDSQ